jgi:hypothetical protein
MDSGHLSITFSTGIARARAFLLHATGNAGKHIVRVSADQTDRADDYDENYGKHDGIFRNVLTFLSRPKGTWAPQHATVAPAFWRADNGPVVLLAVGCKLAQEKGSALWFASPSRIVFCGVFDSVTEFPPDAYGNQMESAYAGMVLRCVRSNVRPRQ